MPKIFDGACYDRPEDVVLYLCEGRSYAGGVLAVDSGITALQCRQKVRVSEVET